MPSGPEVKLPRAEATLSGAETTLAGAEATLPGVAVTLAVTLLGAETMLTEADATLAGPETTIRQLALLERLDLAPLVLGAMLGLVLVPNRAPQAGKVSLVAMVVAPLLPGVTPEVALVAVLLCRVVAVWENRDQDQAR